MKPLTLLVSILLFSTICSYAQAGRNEQKDYSTINTLDKFVKKQMKASKTIGLSSVVMDSSGIVWEKSFGYADKKNNVKADSKTIYCVGSISKTFIGISIMQLYERGEIDIDKPIQKYIPEFKPLGAEEFINDITIRSILTHHSGLPSENLSMFYTGNTFNADTLLAFFNAQHICAPPNTIMSYSNVGYGLLGVLIERVSNMPFHKYVKKNITDPLEMNLSSYNMTEDMKAHYSKQYNMKGKEFVEKAVELQPAGSFMSNVEDMSHYCHMLLHKGTYKDKVILKEETFNEMLRVQNDSIHLDYDMKMGLTWFITLDGTWFKAGGSFGHGGDTRAFHAMLTVLPYQNLASFSVTNSEKGARILMNIDRMFLDKALEIKGIDTTFPKQEYSPYKQKLCVPMNKAHEMDGNYSFDIPLSLKAKKNKIHVNSFFLGAVLKKDNDSIFPIRIRVLGIPIKEKSLNYVWFDTYNDDTVLVLNSWGRDFFAATKIKNTNQGGWLEAKEGIYCQNKHPGTINELKIYSKKGEFYLKTKFYSQRFKLIIIPHSENTAIVPGKGRNNGDRLVFKNENGKEVLYFAGLRLVKK